MNYIPVANPKANYLVRKAEIDNAIMNVLQSGSYILGNEVEKFEEEFAAFTGANYCIGTGSGTDALVLILRALGIGYGDVVATVSFTSVATVSAIDQVGATSLLIDIDPSSFTISPDHLDNALKSWSGSPVKAIIPVHIYGQPAEMDRIVETANRYGACVIEDCAQAHGAMYHGRIVGTIGIASAFSFYPTKNLGALGDGGAVITSDTELADRCRLVRQYGWRNRNYSELNGMNTRLDEVQASILRVKLRYLQVNTQRRKEIAYFYSTNYKNTNIFIPKLLPNTEHVFHQYTIQAINRDKLAEYLHLNGVGTSVLYPKPVNLQPGYSDRILIGSGGLSASEYVSNRVLCLPVYPELTDKQVEKVTSVIQSYKG